MNDEAMEALAIGLTNTLADCMMRLRRCALSAGNADWAVDGLMQPFELKLNGARSALKARAQSAKGDHT